MTKLNYLLATFSLVSLTQICGVIGATYTLSDNIVGNAFYDAFNWEAISDPTHGRVYVCFTSIPIYMQRLTRLQTTLVNMLIKPRRGIRT
jgi:hypothetical protein